MDINTKELNHLHHYGFDDARIKEAAAYPHLHVARVVSQEKGFYRVICGSGEVVAEISGNIRYNAQEPADFPAVGDFVMVDRPSHVGGHAIIHHILPRKSLFSRKSAGKKAGAQVVAANIDKVFICMSLTEDFNTRRLERYLALTWESGATPVVVLTKADLCQELERKVYAVHGVALGVDVIVTSAMDQEGYEHIYDEIKPGKTVALIGSSGVGKSTLINRLLYDERLATKPIREKDGRGRHTTTRRELFHLPNGGTVIDTPGMREMGMWEASSGIDRTFADVEELMGSCRFRNCTHTSEPGCAIHEALESGELSRKRWQSYEKLMAETSYSGDREGYLLMKEKKFKTIAKENKKGNKHKY